MLAGLALSSSSARSEGFDFTFSKGTLSANQILDSSTSPPARYILELGRRICRSATSADIIVIANPLLPLKAAQVAEWLQGSVRCPGIVSDAQDFPLLYILPRGIFEETERFLQLLSAVDANLDAQLLQVVLGRDVARTQLPQLRIGRYPVSTGTGWFQGTERQRVLKVLAANAIKIIARNPDWRDLPFAVYHPYHAGSIVFYAAASRDVTTPLFQRHIVCSPYKDIVAAAGSRLDPIWLKLTWLPRDASVGEPQYFSHALDRLGEAVVDRHFIVFNRYSRNTGASPFHRIDQDRFSLGESLDSPEAVSQLKAPLIRAKCTAPVQPLKVLFHITGGLPIKNYPFDYAKAVFRTLSILGVEVSVIGRPDLVPFGARSIAADETEPLMDAVRQHHIFVGLDSFPHHFVRNILDWPTIGLFGTTTAANFGGGWNLHYRSLDAALPCHPCGAEHECPVFGRKECSNYAKPEQLITSILEMAEQAYGFRA